MSKVLYRGDKLSHRYNNRNCLPAGAQDSANACPSCRPTHEMALVATEAHGASKTVANGLAKTQCEQQIGAVLFDSAPEQALYFTQMSVNGAPVQPGDRAGVGDPLAMLEEQLQRVQQSFAAYAEGFHRAELRLYEGHRASAILAQKPNCSIHCPVATGRRCVSNRHRNPHLPHGAPFDLAIDFGDYRQILYSHVPKGQ